MNQQLGFLCSYIYFYEHIPHNLLFIFKIESYLYWCMAEFWVKYALRVCHIGSIIAICHKTIGDYQTQ